MNNGVSPRFALVLTSALHLEIRNSMSSISFLMHIQAKAVYPP